MEYRAPPYATLTRPPAWCTASIPALMLNSILLFVRNTAQASSEPKTKFGPFGVPSLHQDTSHSEAPDFYKYQACRKGPKSTECVFGLTRSGLKLWLQRVPALRTFWDLEKTVLHEIRVSGTVLWSPTNANSPTYTYISKKPW